MRFNLTIKGFRCYKEDEKKFYFDSNVVLIEGPSGVGKSTILQSIYWVCYGSLTSIYSHGSTVKDRCYVKLEFYDQNITIYRQKRPELLRITLGDSSYEGSVAQDLINSRFGTKENWIAGSYISQGSRSSLLTSSNSEKMAILNSLAFHSSDDNFTPEIVISKINEHLSTLTIKFDILQNQYKENVDIYNNQIKEYSAEIESFVEPEHIEKEICVIEQRLQNLVCQYHTISTLQAKYDQTNLSLLKIPDHDLSISVLESELICCKDKIISLRLSQERWWKISHLKELNDKLLSTMDLSIVKDKLLDNLSKVEEHIQVYQHYLHYEKDYQQYVKLKNKTHYRETLDGESCNNVKSLGEDTVVIQISTQIEHIKEKVKLYRSLSLYWNSYLQLKSIDFNKYSKEQYQLYMLNIELDRRSYPLVNKFKTLQELELRYKREHEDDCKFSLETLSNDLNLLKQWSKDWETINLFHTTVITKDNIKNIISDLNIVFQIITLKRESDIMTVDLDQPVDSLIMEMNDLIKSSESDHTQISQMELYLKQSKETLICPSCEIYLKLVNGNKLIIQDSNVDFMIDDDLLEIKKTSYHRDQIKIKTMEGKIEQYKKRKDYDDKISSLRSQLKILTDLEDINCGQNDQTMITRTICILSMIDFDLIKTIKVETVTNFYNEINYLSELIESIKLKTQIDLLKKEIPEHIRTYLITADIQKYNERERYIFEYQQIEKTVNNLKQSIPKHICDKLDHLTSNKFDLIESLEQEEKLLKQYQDDINDINKLKEIEERMGKTVLRFFIFNNIDLTIKINKLKDEEINIRSSLEQVSVQIRERERLEKEINEILLDLNGDINVELLESLLNELKIDLPSELTKQEEKRQQLESNLKDIREKERLNQETREIKEQLERYTSKMSNNIDNDITVLGQNLNRLRIRLDLSRKTQIKIQQLNDKRSTSEKAYHEVININRSIIACHRLKTIAIESEYHNLQIVVDNLNHSLKTVLDWIFEDPITVHLQLFKTLKSEKGRMKPQVNIKINYRDGEYDNINQLSGGEGDRISLAMTIALARINNSPVLMLDESLSSLDAELKETCLNSIRSLLEDTGKTVICINHDSMTGSYDQIIQLG